MTDFDNHLSTLTTTTVIESSNGDTLMIYGSDSITTTLTKAAEELTQRRINSDTRRPDDVIDTVIEELNIDAPTDDGTTDSLENQAMIYTLITGIPFYDIRNPYHYDYDESTGEITAPTNN